MDEITKFPFTYEVSLFEPLIDEVELNDIVSSLAHTISKRYAGEELILIGILKGSIHIMADLAKKLEDVKVYVDFVKLEAIGRDKEHSGTITITKDISSNVAGKNILIVEEIVDTGRALAFLHDRLKLSNPRSIEILTLFDKPYKRAVPLEISYIGKKINDQFVVGYGLDLEEYGRNLKNVCYLKYPN
jgi:hypoxanthine phosphoribosyltransferase